MEFNTWQIPSHFEEQQKLRILLLYHLIHIMSWQLLLPKAFVVAVFKPEHEP